MPATNEVEARLHDPVTRHMRTDVPRLGLEQTVGEALTALRQNPPESRIIYFYVVNDVGELKGVVPTRRLLLSPADARVRDIMASKVIALPSDATVLEACEFFILHKLLAFPVVENQRLLGAVDVELYTEELSDLDRHEGSEQLFQLIGVHMNAAQQASPVQAFRSRFPWLLTNIAGGVLAAFLSGIFEAELQNAVARALFIPVVLALSESVAIQSVSLSLQALRGKQPALGQLLGKLRNESLTGLFLGLACGLSVALIALLWLWQIRIVVCILGGIVGGVTCSALFGVMIPFVLRLFRREPQVAAGPIALACADISTLVLYFTLARLALRQATSVTP